jgi:phage terminase large subunit GpA-like protein
MIVVTCRFHPGSVKDAKQANEMLDCMIVATGAAIKAGVYSLSDRGWEALRLRREASRATPVPATVPVSSAPDVFPEDATPAPVAEDYWAEHTRRQLENEERVAAENRARFLDRDLAGE